MARTCESHFFKLDSWEINIQNEENKWASQDGTGGKSNIKGSKRQWQKEK